MVRRNYIRIPINNETIGLWIWRSRLIRNFLLKSIGPKQKFVEVKNNFAF